MLKRVLVYTFSLLLVGFTAFGQQYRVCDVSSSPAGVKFSNGKDVLRNIILDGKEVLKFGKFSKISLMETKSKEIFFFSGEGVFSVADVVKKNRTRLSSNQRAHVKDLILGKNHSKMAGVVYKDLAADVHWLPAENLMIVNGKGDIVSPEDILNDGLYYFVVTNTSDVPYFVNVIKTDAEGNATACCLSSDAAAQLDLLAPVGGTVMLSAFPQLGKDLVHSSFRLVACEEMFDANEFLSKNSYIQLLSPPDKSTVTYQDITIRFLLKNIGRVSSVNLLLNGKDTGARISAADGHNEVKVKLVNFGENTIELAVKDTLGYTCSRKITVNYERVNKPKLHVLAVGIGNYRSSSIDKLHYAASDAAMVSQVLDTLRDMNLHLYDNGGYRMLLAEEEATRGNILKCLDDLRYAADPEDIAMIYMSGHGKYVEFKSQRYFLPYDVEDDYIESTAISYADLKAKLKELEDKECKVVVYMDACYAGEMYFTKGASDFIGDSEPAVIGFYSSTRNQPSLEKKELNHGVFTYALLNGIKGGAGDADGNVTISSLGEYITEQVRIESDGRQTPKVDNGGEDFILFKVSDRKIEVSAPVRRAGAAVKAGQPVKEDITPAQKDPVVVVAESYYTGAAVAATAQDEYNAYLAAADKGDARSMYYLGVCHETGKGCVKDAGKAFVWYAKAASQGIAAAQYNLGVMHLNGTGTSQSTDMAFKWLNMAEHNGYAKASTILGLIYYSQEDPQYGKAFEYFSKAAQSGDAMALYYLGECHLYGRGTDEDLYAAHEAYMKSAEKGYSPAKEKLMEMDF